jgi:hypothetical protein
MTSFPLGWPANIRPITAIALLLSGGFISDSLEASETSRFAYQET